MSNSLLVNNKDRKNGRLAMRDAAGSDLPGEISRFQYNLTIGITLLVGFLVDLVITAMFSDALLAMNPIVLLIVYLVMAFGGIAIVYASDKPLFSFLGFMLLSVAFGMILATYLPMFSEKAITDAFVATVGVTVLTMAAGMAFPQFFEKLAPVLFVALIVTIIIELLLTFVFHTSPTIIDYIVAIIFAGYIGYDWYKAQSYTRTYDNAIDSAADLYVDIVNLFIRILAIVSESSD